MRQRLPDAAQVLVLARAIEDAEIRRINRRLQLLRTLEVVENFRDDCGRWAAAVRRFKAHAEPTVRTKRRSA